MILKKRGSDVVIGCVVDAHSDMVISEYNMGYIFNWHEDELKVPLYGNQIIELLVVFKVENDTLMCVVGLGNMVEFKVK